MDLRNKCLILLTIFILGISSINAQDKRVWTFEFLPGGAITPPMPLKIKQTDYYNISITARYNTESFKLPIYYSYRLGSFKNKRGWSVEMNHLKIYLKNTNDLIQQFSISHGYNQVFINHHIVKEKYSWILGIGTVIGHPESTVRNQTYTEKGGFFNDGYYLSGIAFQGAIHYPLITSKHFNLPVESKVSLGYGTVPISNGKAQVPVVAFHLLIGPCFKL
nr:hypothetical protein [uncultured Carboxylicivirga sp.]